ncbi:MAG: hypothetical protein AB8H80_00410 [Planctomycetota bacterium]
MRAFTADFQRERASGPERAEMLSSAAPVQNELAQDYVAWRRAALWVAAVMLTLGAVLALFDFESAASAMASGAMEGQGEMTRAQAAAAVEQVERTFGNSNLSLLDGLQGFLLFIKVAVAGLAIAAAWQWLRVGRSRLLTRAAWLVALAVPLLVSAWPWAQSLDFSHVDAGGGLFGRGGGGQGAMLKQQVSVAIGAMLMVTVAPKLIALFPGIMRSSLALKTLLPQAAAPGWLAVVFAPFLVGFLLLVLSFLSQVEGSWILIAAVTCLAIGPGIYVRRAKDLVRPHHDGEVGEVLGGIRRQALGFHVAGGALLFFYLVDIDSMSWLSVLHLMLEAGGGILLTMVAISDVTLALLDYGHRQSASFHGSELLEAHEQRLAALAHAGLTDIDEAFSLPGRRANGAAAAATMPGDAARTLIQSRPRPGGS